MADTTKSNVRKRKPHRKGKNRRVRKRGGKARSALDAGAQTQPLSEVLNETKHRKAKPWTAIVPISDDPLEQNIVERVPMPEGYIFVPKGNVYITRHCRSKTKESNQIVYLVYKPNGKHTLGIRVPSEIHTTVQESAAATADSRADAVKTRDAKDTSKNRKLLIEKFPLMPKPSLEVILNHAFLKGSGRVGRTAQISDEHRIQLAVEAHIRHVMTPYDKLLDEGVERNKARKRVWDTVQAIERAWQGCMAKEQKEEDSSLALRLA
ncbi:hypothetical protein PENARI_c010G02794 [Penicillium arizonense]|uniref:DUF2293 domain-containing protein n=1 Tax=Penicillium arizonense TaxID=1835702 RepID=A0A1F5LH89_PENAI|nr:hypothetical protein PENARI_c010G02794 [Penicillium arizonense]OGE52380.1 hypothetical protein PENARI_c010G02794 [Penicillium arizonense]